MHQGWLVKSRSFGIGGKRDRRVDGEDLNRLGWEPSSSSDSGQEYLGIQSNRKSRYGCYPALLDRIKLKAKAEETKNWIEGGTERRDG